MQDENHARERHYEERDRERVHAHAPHLDDGQPAPRCRVREGAAHVGREMAEAADGLEGVDGPSAEAFDHGAKLTLHVTRCTSHEGAGKRSGRRWAGRSWSLRRVT